MAAAWARGLVLTALLGLPIPGTSAAQTPWLPTTGPEGGTADLFLQDPVVPGVVYARSQICNECPGRVYRSADGGESWQATSLPEPMELLFVGKDAVYAAGGTRSAIDEDSRAPALQTLFVSRDGGVTWTSSSVLPTDNSFHTSWMLDRVTADPAVPGTMYAPLRRRFVSVANPEVGERNYVPVPSSAIETAHLAVSSDYGRSWRPQHAIWPGWRMNWVAADPHEAGAIYGLDEARLVGTLTLWRLEGTSTWDRLSVLPARRRNSSGFPSERFVGVSVDPARPSTLYYLTSHRLLKSTDGGRNWSATGLPEVPIDALPLPEVLYSGLSEDPRTGTLVALRNPAAPRVSRDGGESWDDLTLPGITLTPRNQVTALGTAPNGASLISVSQLGIWKLDAGATTWRPVNRGFNHAEVVAVAVNPTDARKLVVAVAHPTVSIYRSADAGRSWEPAASGMPDLKDPQSILLSASAASPGVFYVSSQWSYWDEGRGWLLRSPDGGANWFPVLSECQSLSHVVDHPALPGVAYVRCTNGLYRSNDAGLTWALVSNAGGTQGNEYQNFLSPLLLMDRDTPTTLYAIAPAVCAGCDLTVWKSTDGGLTFSEVGVPGWSVRSVAQGADGVLYVPSYKSLDKGLSWVPTCAMAEGCVGPSDLVADPVRAGTLYSNDGRYWSRDGSETWEAFLAHGRQSLGPHAAVPSADGSVLYMPRPFGGLQAVSLASMAECRYSLSDSRIDVGSEGIGHDRKTGIPVQVATQPHCPWSCQSAGFASCTYPESNRSSWQGSASLLISVGSNSSLQGAPPRTMTMMVAGQPLTIRQAAYPPPDAPCKVRLVPKDSYVDHGRVRLLAHAQSATASIETGASCEWTIRSDRSWLTITSATSGTGPSTVSFSVTANPRRASREGHLYTNNTGGSCSLGVGSDCLAIAQMAPGFPEIVVQPSPQTVGEGQFATFNVEARGEEPLRYEWYVLDDGWEPVRWSVAVPIDSPSLTIASTRFWHLNPQVFMVDVENPIGYRMSNPVGLRIDGETGTSRCAPVLATNDDIVALDGGYATLRIGVGEGCRWGVTGVPDWITSSHTVGAGATTVSLAVKSNLGGKPREAVLQVGTQGFRVRQEGTDCPVELSGPGFSRTIRPHDALTVLADRLCAWDVTTSNPWLRVDSIMTITNEGGPPYRDPHWSASHGGTRGAGSGRITFVFEPLPPVVDNQTGRLGWVKVGRAEIGAEQFPLLPIFTGFASPYLGRLRCEILPNQARPDLWLQGFSNAASTGSFQVHQSCYDAALAGHPLASRPWTASSDVSWVSIASGEVHDNGTSLVGFTVEADPSATACRRGRVLVAGWPVNVSQGCGATALGTPLVEVSYFEITQAIQRPRYASAAFEPDPAEVPLIAGRPTFVRVQFQAAQELERFSTYLLVRAARSTDPFEAISPLGSKGVEVFTRLTRVSNTLVYRLPDEYLTGEVELKVGPIPGALKEARTTARFVEVRRPTVKFFPMRWKGSDGSYREPSSDDVASARRQVMQVFPLADFNPYVTPAVTLPDFVGRPDIASMLTAGAWLAMLRFSEGSVDSEEPIYMGLFTGIGSEAGEKPTQGWAPYDGVALAYIDDPLTVPHEMAHLFGRDHVDSPESSEDDNADPDYPYEEGGIRPGFERDPTLALQPFDIYDIGRFFRSYGSRPTDLMSYGQMRWVSDYTFNGILRRLRRPLTGEPLIAANRATGEAGDTAGLLIGGTVGTQSALDRVWPTVIGGTRATSGAFRIRLEDGAGNGLASVAFDPAGGAEGPFVVVAPNPGGVKALTLLGPSGEVLAQRRTSANVPQVQVTSPNGGEHLGRAARRVSWTATDADGDPLSAVVQFSSDSGVTWQTVAMEVAGPSVDVDFSALPGTTQGLVRVTVSDGFLFAADASDLTFTVANGAPRLFVRAPARVSDGSAAWLDADVWDAEDGSGRPPVVTWTSDRQGSLGTGTALYLRPSTLNPGRHVITVEASDSLGTATTQSFTLDVVVDALVPSAGTHLSYLAEGATSSFLDTRIALLNPSDRDTIATLGYARADGTSVLQNALVAARSRLTVFPKTVAGVEGAEFSTVVQSDEPLVVDRTMSWDGAAAYGAHAETALHSTSTTWYLAEGATHSGFDLFYLLQNPASTPATVRVRYLRPSGEPLEKTYTLAANSRTNIWVDTEDLPGLGTALANTDVSAVIDSIDGVPIIVERAMYLSNQGRLFNAGHESAGITSPATRWFLAEGATGDYFDMFILFANPNNADAEAKVTYLLPDGTTYVRTLVVPGNTRQNIWVDYDVPDGTTGFPLLDTAVSTTIEVTNGVPIIVERAMWWPGTAATWHEAHNSAGATTAGTMWALAEGEVDASRNLETYILVANTSTTPADVRVTLLFEDGSSAEQTYPRILPNSRFNVPVGGFFPQAAGKRFGAIVESLGTSPARIVVERAMYWDALGQWWAAGTNALATMLK